MNFNNSYIYFLFLIKSKHVKYFQTSSIRSGLSDPFKPSQKKSLEDSKKIYEEKLKNIKHSDGYKFSEKPENFITRMVRKSLNPTPINTEVRAKFGITADYKLCYLINNERVHLIVFGLMNSVFPAFFALVGILTVTELTGQSQFFQSFENPSPKANAEIAQETKSAAEEENPTTSEQAELSAYEDAPLELVPERVEESKSPVENEAPEKEAVFVK